MSKHGGPGDAMDDPAKYPMIKLQVFRVVGPYTAWIVDGLLIRNRIFIDFTAGGNPWRYKWIPPRELWLDGDNFREFNPNLIHELGESNRMQTGMAYDPAHDAVNVVEQRVRDYPDLFESILQQEIDTANRLSSKVLGGLARSRNKIS